MSPRRWGPAPAHVFRVELGPEHWIAVIAAPPAYPFAPGQMQRFDTHAEAIEWAAEESGAVHFGIEERS